MMSQFLKSCFGIFMVLACVLGTGLLIQLQAAEPKSYSRIQQLGWMSPLADGNFHGEKAVTRAELASALVKAFDIDKRKPFYEMPVPVGDVPETHWAYHDIQLMLANKVMTGYRDNLFYPNQVVDRAEGYAIVAQAYGVFQYTDEMLAEIYAPYIDAHNIPDWAKLAVATAIEFHFVDGVKQSGDQQQLNPQAPMTRNDLAYALTQYINRAEAPHSPKGL